MAKKGQAVQLQSEINNDEEWDRLLQREGLIIVDVYSEWCGPCSGMSATLKKLKLEIGGDLLHLAAAKSDKITALERFRNKSEPTWMFIVNGKMVNFMFGANAPKLTRLIIEELQKEEEARSSGRERVQLDISELADEERDRQEVIENMEREAREKEETKAAKELLERRTAEANNILENLSHLGVILIFPHARTMYQDAFGDLLGEAGLQIAQTEKVNLNKEILNDIFYFQPNSFPDYANEELCNKESLLLLIKPISSQLLEAPILDLLLKIVDEAMKKLPASFESSSQILNDKKEKDLTETIGAWTPDNKYVVATVLRLFFKKIVSSYLIKPPELLPPHYCIVFDAIKRTELKELLSKYSTEIFKYGFFTSETPEESTLVAKSIKKYEKSLERKPDQKMVIQLSKRQSECVLAFIQMKPLYISPNAEEGKRECALFFPDDYIESDEDNDAEELLEVIQEKSEQFKNLLDTTSITIDKNKEKLFLDKNIVLKEETEAEKET